MLSKTRIAEKIPVPYLNDTLNSISSTESSGADSDGFENKELISQSKEKIEKLSKKNSFAFPKELTRGMSEKVKWSFKQFLIKH